MRPLRHPPPATRLLTRVLGELGIDCEEHLPSQPSHPVPLASRLAVSELAWASVNALVHTSGATRPPDPDRIALSYRSDRYFRLDGVQPDVWSPYSGFWRTRDGWIRSHGNYPHHAAGLLTGLGLAPTSDKTRVSAVLAERTSAEALDAILAAGGLAVAVSSEDGPGDAARRATPVLNVHRHGDKRSTREHVPLHRLPPVSRPLRGTRVLDLTRVIAGPVCTRSLALLGADVLRIDPPRIPEPEWQHLDSGHGKRSASLDARSEAMHELLGLADVAVLGYRPSALARLGLAPESLAERYPNLIIAQLSAWGLDQPDRAGFDSLVQAESGIAVIEAGADAQPGSLPAQALDHSAGYLLAAAVTAMLRRQRSEGGSWFVHTSLRRIAAELLGMPRLTTPRAVREINASMHTVDFAVRGRRVTTIGPVLPDVEYASPRAWAEDQPRW